MHAWYHSHSSHVKFNYSFQIKCQGPQGLLKIVMYRGIIKSNLIVTNNSKTSNGRDSRRTRVRPPCPRVAGLGTMDDRRQPGGATIVAVMCWLYNACGSYSAHVQELN